jgi:hypothetical protein
MTVIVPDMILRREKCTKSPRQKALCSRSACRCTASNVSEWWIKRMWLLGLRDAGQRRERLSSMYMCPGVCSTPGAKNTACRCVDRCWNAIGPHSPVLVDMALHSDPANSRGFGRESYPRESQEAKQGERLCEVRRSVCSYGTFIVCIGRLTRLWGQPDGQRLKLASVITDKSNPAGELPCAVMADAHGLPLSGHPSATEHVLRFLATLMRVSAATYTPTSTRALTKF